MTAALSIYMGDTFFKLWCTYSNFKGKLVSDYMTAVTLTVMCCMRHIGRWDFSASVKYVRLEANKWPLEFIYAVVIQALF